jgi:hypothetical protein
VRRLPVTTPRGTEAENARPIGERADLAAAGVVAGLELDLGALARLLAAQARDPCRPAGEHAAERLDLAQRAAGLPQLDALPHRVFAMAADERITASCSGR